MESRAAIPPAPKPTIATRGRNRSEAASGTVAASSPARPAHLHGDEPPQRRGGLGPEQFGLAAPEVLHVLGRQIDTAPPGVLSDVLQVLDDLQAYADLVRERQPLGGLRPENGQHEPSHGRRRQHAVRDEVTEAADSA